MNTERTIFDTINILYDSFYRQEKKIASYILHNPEQMIHMSISQLALQNDTSVATITRFCRKCSVDGFHHLKIELARALAQRQENTVSGGKVSVRDIEGSLQNILANKVEEITQTISMIDPDVLKKVLNGIRNAGQVLFFAVGNTIPCAMDGAYKFNEIGISSAAFSIWENAAACSLNMKKGDCVIALSNSGESIQVINVLQAAKERGITTVAITNNPKSQAAQIAEYHLQTATREKMFQDEVYFSRISLMTVIEVFYLFLSSDLPDSYEKLMKCEQMFARTKI